MMDAPLFSLILATYGRADELGVLIDSLVAQTERRFELIVVDQNQDDRLAPSVTKALEAGIRLVHLRLAVANLSAARNLGLSAARGDWLAFPDDDCWYESQTLAEALSASLQQPQSAMLVGDWVELSAARLSSARPQDPLLSWQAWREFRGGDASSITLFVRRDLAQRMGGFDERMGVGQWFGSAEETDFVLTALGQGVRAKRAPQIRVHHRFTVQSASSLQRRQLWRDTVQRARGTGALYAKHRLSNLIIARGLIAPCVQAVLGLLSRRHGVNELVRAAALVVGRWQGWRSWARGPR